jgi:hypothetical protein
MRTYRDRYDNCLSLLEHIIPLFSHISKSLEFPFNQCLTKSINKVNPSLIGIMQKQTAMLDSEHAILETAKRDGRKYYFLICDICCWCASLFEPNLSKYCTAFLCPVCEGSNIQVIPLASDEVSRLK